MTKQTIAPLIAGLLLLSGQQAQAHLHTHDIGALSNVGDSVSGTTFYSGTSGWIAGTDNNLGDSHWFNNGAISFSLTQAAKVQISVAANVAINPAFSVYAGVLPQAAHDYQTPDDFIDAQEQFGSGADAYSLMGKASITDKRPDDPLIRRYIPAGYDANGKPLTYDGYSVIMTENPIWNTPDPNLGGLSPAQWYEANYQPHNGYVDRLNFTTQGGMVYNSDFNAWYPANIDLDKNIVFGFTGQFDAFGDWSMANDSGEWAKLHYISSVSSTACDGPNCLTTDTSGFSNAGHFAGNDGLTETLTLMLGPGVYSIFADGEACMEYDSNCPVIGGSIFDRNITYTATLLAPAAVPLPGAFWLMGSAVLGLSGLRANRARC